MLTKRKDHKDVRISFNLVLKMAKLNDQDQELADDFEVKRRVKNSSTYRNSFLALNEDSSTFNGVEMF